MNAPWNAPISDRFSSLCARVFSPAAAILESEKTLGTRLEKTRIQGSHKMEELGGKITEVFGNVSWNKESLGSGSVEVHQYHSADQYFILAKKKAGGSIRVRCLQL